MAQPIHFTVSSGAICFGPLPDILRASHIPIQPPPNPRPQSGGTIIFHPLEHNVAAQHGTWHAYPLINTKSPGLVDAWFAAHEDVDPLSELQKLLRVAGSPYEYESGYRTNCDATRAEQVLLVNRYDWDVSEDDEFARRSISSIIDEEGDDFMPNRNTIGVVDYVHAAVQVQDWTNSSSSQRVASQHGVWMHIPWPEYMWARLGFNDEYTHARSLLFFTQRTEFFTTGFPGESGPLRTYETELERFHRGSREGKDYSGIAKLREMYTPSPRNPPQSIISAPPAATDLLGPYPKDQHVLSPRDIELLRESIELTGSLERGIFADSYQDELFNLLNELVLSYVEHFVLPLRSHSSPSSLGLALFPNHSRTHPWGGRDLDSDLLECFSGPPTTALDIAQVAARIQAFLERRAGDRPIAFSQDCITSLVQVVGYIITDVIKGANIRSFGNGNASERVAGEKCIMVPEHVRLAVYIEHYDIFQYSRVLWFGE